jgi:HSP20 family protein
MPPVRKKVKRARGPVVALRPPGYRFEAEAFSDGTVAWNPSVDVYETEGHYVVNAEVPGVESRDLRIEIAGSELQIRGERRFDAVCSQESYYCLEAIRGPFSRTFSLPEPLDHARVRVAFDNGILEIILPKLERR